MKSHRQFLSAALLGAALALSGCVVAPAPGYYGARVMVAPPPLRAEVYGVAPYPGYFWMGGYWNWVGGRHVWVDGHWQAPRRGYAWVAHHWDRDGDGWRIRPGHWERAHR
jgi:hypothetical protein